VVNDNVVDLIITPGKNPGDPATVRTRPEASFLRLDARVTTIPAGKKARTEIRNQDDWALIVRGEVPVRTTPLVRIHAVEDPTAYARSLFLEALGRAGVTVKASPLEEAQGELPERGSRAGLELVAKYTSPPFAEAIKVTLKVSHNLYASTMPLLVAVKQGKRTVAEGMAAEKAFLAELGVPLDAVAFGGGAGGANADHVTPRATVQLLRGLMKRSDFPGYQAGLPVLGVDGTLAKAVPATSPARGKAQAKTGTLQWHDLVNDRPLLTSKALAGTLTTAKGRMLVFAMFVNNVPLRGGANATSEGRALGQLCEVLYEHAP
jgi:D-alanyl-D-alanine carboxypeptidase/D-alanyl-D-alanine-endopeptidase (penicillin-binding protein 4)